ncbi:hypothetical protein I5P86_08310 [Pseudomonas glycinae]|uniref:hypothetical protein n=1 Tax=Pseudomonas glycinae TaxID=1785145 RepID=UPI0018D85F17|nr:hypothetical protein [Pseudomonas glycinae]MBH3405049.1 hypothetical protein [Pseudomonas glycinae]
MKALVFTNLPVDESNEKILNTIKAHSSDTVLNFEREPGATTGKVYYVPAANTVRSSATVDKIRLADYGGVVLISVSWKSLEFEWF